MPYRSTTSWPVSSRRLSNTGTGNAALPETKRAGRCACTGDSAILLPDGRHAEEQRGAGARRGGVPLRRRATRVHQAAAGPEQEADAEHESVHVKRAARGRGRRRASTPRRRRGRRDRGERGAGEEHALGQAGRPRCRARRRRRRRAPSPVYDARAARSTGTCSMPWGSEGRRRASARGPCRQGRWRSSAAPESGGTGTTVAAAQCGHHGDDGVHGQSRARRHVHGRQGLAQGGSGWRKVGAVDVVPSTLTGRPVPSTRAVRSSATGSIIADPVARSSLPGVPAGA